MNNTITGHFLLKWFERLCPLRCLPHREKYSRRIKRWMIPALLLYMAMFSAGGWFPFYVQPVRAQSDSINPYDLIAAVNSLRASYGLPPFEVDGTLMAIAQSHSEYQASVGNWTHYSADGSNPQGRALAAGYGGGKTIIVSENVAEVWSGQNFDVSDVIYQLWNDSVHWNTMINPQYIQAGAGVAVADGVQYITLDVGYIAGMAPAASYATSAASPTPTSFKDVVVAVQASTPLADGSVYHIVQPGQVLVTIARIYGVDVNELAALNNISPDSIYAGDKLIIQMPYTPTIVLPSSTPLPGTPTGEWTARVGAILETNQALTPTQTPTPKPPTLPMSRTTVGMVIAVVVGLLALLGINYVHTK